jgi:hypothetical protein
VYLSHLPQVIKLRKKLSGAADAVKGLFGVGKGNDEVVEKLEKMQVCAVHAVRAVWRAVIGSVLWFTSVVWCGQGQ